MKIAIKYFSFSSIILILLTNIVLAQTKQPETLTNKIQPTISKKETIMNESLASQVEKTSSDLVLIQTDKGPIKIKLFTKEAPATTNNFTDLVKKGFYNYFFKTCLLRIFVDTGVFVAE